MHSRQYIITSCLAYHEIDCKRKLQNILSFWLTCQHLPSLAHVCQYLLKNQPHKPLTLQTHAHESAEYITQPRLIIHSQTRTHPPTLTPKHTHTHAHYIYHQSSPNQSDQSRPAHLCPICPNWPTPTPRPANTCTPTC